MVEHPPHTAHEEVLNSEAVFSAASVAAAAAEKVGILKGGARVPQNLATAGGAVRVGKTALAGGAAVASATGLTVAATSGAGIASGLAAAGGVVGGGMAAGPAVLAGGPAYLAAKGLNSTLFKHDPSLPQQEQDARGAARKTTNVAAAAGVLGTGAAVVAGGTSGAAIMGTLATVGGIVGGGALAGTAVLVAAPALFAGAAGYGIYRYVRGKNRDYAEDLKLGEDVVIPSGALPKRL